MPNCINDKAETSVRLDFLMESKGEVIEIRDQSPSLKASGSYINSEVLPTDL